MSNRWQTSPTYDERVGVGQIPSAWIGVDLPDGDYGDWFISPVGTEYMYKPNETGVPKVFVKRAAEGRDDDWAILGGSHVIQQRVEYTDFTDGGGATGTLVLSEQIPIGAIVYRATLVDLDDFVGSAAVTLTVGDGTDVDRYNTGTPSLAASLAQLDLGAPSGVIIHAVAATITITVTDDSDFGDISAGGFTFRLYYWL
jgi:hypothetical protein